MTLGQTNRTRVTARDLPHVIEQINRLPFAFVGAKFVRTAVVTVAGPNTWTAFTMFPEFDEDSLLMADATRAQIPRNGDGVYQLHISARHNTPGNGRVKLTVNGTTVFAYTLLNTEVLSQSSPILRLRAGDIIQWWYWSTNVGGALGLDSATTDNGPSPAVSIIRLGLTP